MDTEYKRLFRLTFPSDCTDLIDEFAYSYHNTPLSIFEKQAVFINQINVGAVGSPFNYQNNFLIFSMKLPQIQYGIINKYSVGIATFTSGVGGGTITYSQLPTNYFFTINCDGKSHPIKLTNYDSASYSSGNPSVLNDCSIKVNSSSDFQIVLSCLGANPSGTTPEFHVYCRICGWFFQ